MNETVAVETFDWTTENILYLIQLYRQKELLWNPNHPRYYSKKSKSDSWTSIARTLNISVENVKSKIVSLLSSYRREKGKVKKSKNSGKGPDEVYVSNWFAFPSLEFLAERNQPIQCLNTEDIKFLEEHDENDVVSGSATDNENSIPSTSQAPGPSRKRKARHDQEQKCETNNQQADNSISASYKIRVKDEYEVFAMLVATKLRTLSRRRRLVVMNEIQNLLFRAEMEQIQDK